MSRWFRPRSDKTRATAPASRARKWRSHLRHPRAPDGPEETEEFQKFPPAVGVAKPRAAGPATHTPPERDVLAPPPQT